MVWSTLLNVLPPLPEENGWINCDEYKILLINGFKKGFENSTKNLLTFIETQQAES